MFLPAYKFDIHSGVWSHRDEKEQNVRTWLGEIDYSGGDMGYRENNTCFVSEGQEIDYQAKIQEAKSNLIEAV